LRGPKVRSAVKLQLELQPACGCRSGRGSDSLPKLEAAAVEPAVVVQVSRWLAQGLRLVPWTCWALLAVLVQKLECAAAHRSGPKAAGIDGDRDWHRCSRHRTGDARLRGGGCMMRPADDVRVWGAGQGRARQEMHQSPTEGSGYAARESGTVTLQGLMDGMASRRRGTRARVSTPIGFKIAAPGLSMIALCELIAPCSNECRVASLRLRRVGPRRRGTLIERGQSWQKIRHRVMQPSRQLSGIHSRVQQAGFGRYVLHWSWALCPPPPASGVTKQEGGARDDHALPKFQQNAPFNTKTDRWGLYCWLQRDLQRDRCG